MGDISRQFKQTSWMALWVDFRVITVPDCLRFKDGKAIGKWLVWNQTGKFVYGSRVQEPYDFIGHLK